MTRFKDINTFCVCFCFLKLVVSVISDRYVFKINGNISEISNILSVYDFKDVLKITPSVYSFKYGGFLNASKTELVLSQIKSIHGDKIVEIEPVFTYAQYIPVDANNTEPTYGRQRLFLPQSTPQYNESLNYFGMNVEEAWKKGYIGSGVNIAVIDIGIPADIDDLKGNLNMGMAFNFYHNTTDVSPEKIFMNYKAKSMSFLSHGIKCASIIAAEKGNSLCNAGIAYNGKIVPLKVFSLLYEYHRFKIHTTDDFTASALNYRIDEIQIFSNSWTWPSKKFSLLGLGMREAILRGVTAGRNKLGVIYVFPDGSDGIIGHGAANSIYTIAVNSVGIGGKLPKTSEVSACIITSGLDEGNRLHTKAMMTSTFNNACVSFKGVSAAVAEVSAVIALVLQARPDLTYRDVQLLLAVSSDWDGLAESSKFKPNGAGLYFHPVLGFGLLNADKAVTNARSWRLVGQMYNNTLGHVKTHSFLLHHRFTTSVITTVKFHLQANPCRRHVNTIEQVLLRIGYDVIKQGARIEVVSPSDTKSVIVNNDSDENIDQRTSPRELTSVHFLGESPFGYWKIRMQFRHKEVKISKDSISLIVFGTYNITKGNPLKNCSHKPYSSKGDTSRENHYTAKHHYDKPNHGITPISVQPVTVKSKKKSTAARQQKQNFLMNTLGLMVVYFVLRRLCTPV